MTGLESRPVAVALTVLTDPGDPSARRTVLAAPGATLLRAAQEAGVELTATCGGRGRCTSCRVKFVGGALPPPTIADEVQLGDAQIREGYRLACQYRVDQPVTVLVAPPLQEHAFQILGGASAAAVRAAGLVIDAGVVKQVVKVGVPREEHHQTSDVEQLAAALGRRPADVGPGILADLPATLREDGGLVTVTTFGGDVLAVERGDTARLKFGLAVDVGTTTVVTSLLELESGEVLASVSSLNPQAAYGADLMSRIAFAQFNPANRRRLTTRILGLLNQQVAEVCREAGVPARWIYKVVIVGNTVMHHLVLGIDPTYVGLAPYAPVMRHPLVVPARDLNLKVAPEARVCFLPLVAGFVGADAVAVALATRLDAGGGPRLAVDIGTNGEVLLAAGGRLLACSAPAGPALEGAQIRCGMRAAAGAVDRVEVGDDLRVHTIGEAPALGLCGSGLIDLVAGLLDAGVIDPTGLIQVEPAPGVPPALRARVLRRGEERLVIVRHPGEAGVAREIVLTQDDVRQVQLAKGAIAAGIAMLLRVAGLEPGDLEELLLAGGFGNYVSVRSAQRIGLVPPLPVERVRYVGNAAALGAQMCLLSETERQRAAALADAVEHVSLAAHPDFETVFVEAMNFPPAGPGSRPT